MYVAFSFPLTLEQLWKYFVSLPDLVLFIEGSKFAFKSYVFLQCIINLMTLDAPKVKLTVEGKFRNLNYEDGFLA